MDSQENPTLLTILFGENASLVLKEASPRLRCWCRAFDQWLEEQRSKDLPKIGQISIRAWKRMLGKLRKYPLEISQEDVKGYIGWMQEQGFAASTIKSELTQISNFYRWCIQRQIDAGNWEACNPTEGVRRPKIRRIDTTRVLSVSEAQALLAILKLDDAILTKRDYAFFLARLQLGVPIKKLQQLQWGQIEEREEGVWVNWRGGGSETTPLPEEVYQAMVDYLRASGRLEGMRAGDYIFAPLAEALKREASGAADEWDEKRYLGSKQIRLILKTYGQEAGIPAEKLTLPTLRRTAAMLRLEAGDSLEAMQAFLHCPQLESTRRYLNAMPPPAEESVALRDLKKDPPHLPERTRYVFRPWERMTHGTRARSQPPQEVAAVLAEEVRGMEDEIIGLRLLNRGLMEMQNHAAEAAEVAMLTDAYTRSATRLGEMIRIEAEMKKTREEDDWPEKFLEKLAQGAAERGEHLDIEKEKALALGGKEALAANARRLAEEIASVRVALRRTFCLAMDCREARERAHLTEIYSRGCHRLVRLLRLEGEDNTRLKIYLNELIDKVILDVGEELGLR